MKKPNPKDEIVLLSAENKRVGRDEYGRFIIGNKAARSKLFSIDDFLDGVDYVANETGVPLPVQLMRMAYQDARLMGKVLDKFVANVSAEGTDKKQLIQVIVQSYLGSPGDVDKEKIIEIPNHIKSVTVQEKNISSEDILCSQDIIDKADKTLVS
jgi:chemotaxis regulatin CheY-phosphate phosphatase CheZ